MASLARKVLLGLAAFALAALAGAAAVSWVYWSPRYALAAQAATTAKAWGGIQESAAKTCAATLDNQNDAFKALSDAIEKADVAATQARDEARLARQASQDSASAILAERTPAGADACQAARAAFDADLRKERGK